MGYCTLPSRRMHPAFGPRMIVAWPLIRTRTVSVCIGDDLELLHT